jgi:uncharacterized protein (TIGR00369 family)
VSSTAQPRFADWEARVRASFAKQGAMAHLGVEIAELAPGRCVLAARYAPALSQQHGFFHAGVTSAVADSAGGYAALTLFAAERDVLTVEFKLNLMAPAKGERIVATGEVVRSGRTLTTCLIRVDVHAGETAVPCALMLQTVMAVEPR